VNAHRVTSKLHTETSDIRQTQDEVELIKVDDDECDPFLERLADVQTYSHFALRWLEGSVTIQNAQMVGGLMYRKTIPSHETGVDKRHARSSVVQTHRLRPRTMLAQERWDLEEGVARRP
jgi:hypothetical protein